MKKLFLQRGLVGVILTILAFAFGASHAMAAVTGASTDDKGLETQLPGTAASGTQIDEGDLARREIDEYVANFRPFSFTAYSDFMSDAKVSKKNAYEIEHFSSGQEVIECETNAAIDNSTTMATTVTLPVASTDKYMFSKDVTIQVKDVNGYDYDDNTIVDGDLMLIVLEKTTAGVITVEALNGPLNGTDMYVPDIALGAELAVCGNACAESQMLVAPENHQPVTSTVFLQKKITNILMTDFFQSVKKEIPFNKQELLDDALFKFKRKNARSMWIGCKSKRKVNQGETMGDEYVYSSKGVVRQVDRLYGVQDVLTYDDLIGIAKMQFTKNAVNNEANVYGGQDFIESLQKIDFTRHQDVEWTKATHLGVDIKSFTCTFGKLNFKYDPSLDDVGMEGMAVVLDMIGTTRYVMIDDKKQHIDMKDGAGDAREATRDIVTQIDAIALRGHNSILIGESEELFAKYSTTATVDVTTVAAVPLTPTDDDIIYLSAEDSPWPAGSLLIYSAEDEAWSEYKGEIRE